MFKTPARILCVMIVIFIACPCASALADGQHRELIPATPGGGYVGFALDGNGLPWIAYMDNAGQLRVLHRTLAGWEEEAPSGPLWTSRHLSMDVDPDGGVHILASRYGDLQVFGSSVDYHFREESGDWHRIQLTTGAVSTEAIVIDSEGWPHLAYNVTHSENPRHRWQDDSGWHIESVPVGHDGVGVAPEMYITDDDDLVMVAYKETSYGSDVYRRTDGIWAKDTSAPAITLGATRGAIVDGVWLHLINRPAGSSTHLHISESPSGWNSSVLTSASPGGYVSFDANGGPEGVFYMVRPYTDYCRLYQYGIAGWHGSSVPFTDTVVMDSPASDVDGQGRVHVAGQSSNGVTYLVLSDYAEPEPSFDADLSVSPTTFGPGWNLNYTLVITNTGPFDLPDLAATSVVPEGACCPANGADTDLFAEITDAPPSLRWDIPMLEVGEVLRLTYRLHSLSMVGDGETISNTVSIGAAYMGTTTVGVEAACDMSLAPTATPTCTPSPTPTTPAYGLALPMIMMDKP